MIACAHCGSAMPTPTGRASRKRYCGVDCRKAAWRQRHRDDIPDVIPAVALAVPAVPAVPTAFPDNVRTPGGRHRCPHCRQPSQSSASSSLPTAPSSTHRRCCH
jgi:hypothetical protein